MRWPIWRLLLSSGPPQRLSFVSQLTLDPWRRRSQRNLFFLGAHPGCLSDWSLLRAQELTLLPPSSAGSSSELIRPAKDCILLLLPEQSHCPVKQMAADGLRTFFAAAAAFPTVGLQNCFVSVAGLQVGHLNCSDFCAVLSSSVQSFVLFL